MLRGIWYLISDVNVGAQTLTIAIPYAAINLAGFPYTIATTINDVWIKNITIKNSTASAIKFSYGNESLLENVSLLFNTEAVEINSSSGIPFNNVDASSGTTGFDFNDFHHSPLYTCNIIDMSGNGIEMFMCCNSLISAGFIGQIGGDGIQINYTEKMIFHGVTVRQCGEQGVEIVSNNSVIEFEGCDISYNTSDGIKLTATSDNCVITHCIFHNNGGYGWNIAASSCDYNIIRSNQYSGNTLGAYSDSGTGTDVIELSDYILGDILFTSADTERISSHSNWTKVKEIKINRSGLGIRIKFDGWTTSPDPGQAAIFKNGVQIGTTRNLTGGYVTYSEDFGSFNAGDLFQLYERGANPIYYQNQFKNFRLYIGEPRFNVILN
jgi:hypothetical protein